MKLCHLYIVFDNCSVIVMFTREQEYAYSGCPLIVYMRVLSILSIDEHLIVLNTSQSTECSGIQN